MFTNPKTFIVVIAMLLISAACSLSPRDQQVNQGAVDTQVAQTMAAQLQQETQAAQQTQVAQGINQISPTEDTPEATQMTVPTFTPTTPPTATQDYKPQIGVQSLGLGGEDQLYEFSIEELMFDYTGSNDQAGFEDGKFYFLIKQPISFDIWTFSWIEDKNYYAEITVQMPDQCSGKDRAGFIFRTPLDSYEKGYLFQISCDGHFRLTNWDGSDYYDLIPWKGNNTIHTGGGAINRIGIYAEGNDYRLFVNAEEVGSYNDAVYFKVGKVGLAIGVGNTQDFKVRFDDFAYWDLP